MRRMESSTTSVHRQSLTKAIVEHRLQPGTKLAEQKLADHFGVSRTLVRQALLQLSQNQLVTLEPARGAFVAAPSVNEARQVFAVRRMLECRDDPRLCAPGHAGQDRALRSEHVAQEKAAIDRRTCAGRTELLGDFHVRMAELMGNEVLAQMLGQLISRCALITLMYQTTARPNIPTTSTVEIVRALAAKDEERAVRLMTSTCSTWKKP
jgi:DNA-binding GntR family transcriptional regulator